LKGAATGVFGLFPANFGGNPFFHDRKYRFLLMVLKKMIHQTLEVINILL